MGAAGYGGLTAARNADPGCTVRCASQGDNEPSTAVPGHTDDAVSPRVTARALGLKPTSPADVTARSHTPPVRDTSARKQPAMQPSKVGATMDTHEEQIGVSAHGAADEQNRAGLSRRTACTDLGHDGSVQPAGSAEAAASSSAIGIGQTTERQAGQTAERQAGQTAERQAGQTAERQTGQTAEGQAGEQQGQHPGCPATTSARPAPEADQAGPPAPPSMAFTIDFGSGGAGGEPEITDRWKHFTPYRVHSGVREHAEMLRRSKTKLSGGNSESVDAEIDDSGKDDHHATVKFGIVNIFYSLK